MSKTWFITGASRGFGRAWTVAALERGDSVAATVRVFFGAAPLGIAEKDYESRLQGWRDTQHLAELAQG